jgi:Ca2+-binding RTX toxin-like protein
LDTVETTVNFTLASGVSIELLRAQSATSTNALELIGNQLSQEIVGNSGNNRLDGKGGSDLLTGGKGKDTFVFSADPLLQLSMVSRSLLRQTSSLCDLHTHYLSLTPVHAP